MKKCFLGLLVCFIALTQSPSLAKSDMGIPSHIQNAYETYKQIYNSVDLGLRAIGEIESPTQNSESYRFSVNSHDVRFYAPKGEDARKSFCCYFSSGSSTKDVKNFITATIMAFSSLGLEEAEEKMGDLIVSYSGEGHSETLKLDGYTMFLQNVVIVGGTDVRMVAEEEAILRDYPENYQEMGYKLSKAPLSDKEKIKITGYVTKQYQSTVKSVPKEFLTVNTDDGEYTVFFDFEEFPVYIRDDVALDFYGVIRHDVKQYGTVCIEMKLVLVSE